MSIAGRLKPSRRSRRPSPQHRYSVVEFSPAREATSGLLVWHAPRSAGCLQGKRPKAGPSLRAFKLARSSAAAPPLVRRSITWRLICSRRSISIEFEGPDSRPPQEHQTNQKSAVTSARRRDAAIWSGSMDFCDSVPAECDRRPWLYFVPGVEGILGASCDLPTSACTNEYRDVK